MRISWAMRLVANHFDCIRDVQQLLLFIRMVLKRVVLVQFEAASVFRLSLP